MNHFTESDCMVYAVTDRHYLPDGMSLEEAVSAAIRGGITMLQLREKDLPREELKTLAIRIRDLCRDAEIPFILDDDVLLAKEIGADGVHIGQTDMPADQARQILGPDAIIGVTAKTVEQAKRAEYNGADYLGCGAMFPTSTKPGAKPMTTDLLSRIARSVFIPAAAIGGINEKNLPKLAGTGIAGVAVSEGIFGQPDIEKAARAMRHQMEMLSPHTR